jgi:hypothetical protein
VARGQGHLVFDQKSTSDQPVPIEVVQRRHLPSAIADGAEVLEQGPRVGNAALAGALLQFGQ